MLSGKTILITGGTGSFGQQFVSTVLERYPDVRRVIVFSRDELKQYEMAQKISPKKYSAIRYFLGDVRDYTRLMRAFEEVDVVVHAAALKQVPAAEYNPMECIKTNIFGAENVTRAALDSKVSRVVALSTDKAAAPINLYGATKLCSDKLFIASNFLAGNRNLRFSVVRYGNVLGSRGSVIPFFLKLKSSGANLLPITHPEMTRFSISLEQGVEMVLHAIEHAHGGEIYVPKIPSYRILDVAKAIAPSAKTEVVGIRPGEKLHEEMITEMDSLNTYELAKHYVIAPNFEAEFAQPSTWDKIGKRVDARFRYNSGSNPQFLTVEEIREAIRQHVDPAFKPR